MLDLRQLQDQFGDFTDYQVREHARRQWQLDRARTAFGEAGRTWQRLQERAQRIQQSWLIPKLREAPNGIAAAEARPTPMTVVATDGSQIYPDRHIEPTCYLLNVSRIAFQYGTLERPIMESVPSVRYRRDDLRDAMDALDPQPDGKATAEVVSALRDDLELKALFGTAVQARVDGRPLVAMADGTLIRWMLRGMRDRALEQQLIARYTATLTQFREERLPLCSYISMPGNTEVVNLLRVHCGEADGDVDPDDSLEGLPDRHLFETHLAPGERSAVFESASHIQDEYGAENRICYFYLHVPVPGGCEIGRVEVPHWVADDEALLRLVHAVVLNECDKGDGYPMILSEAHERAVVRAAEKEVFYQLVEDSMTGAGLSGLGSRKAASKRKPTV